MRHILNNTQSQTQTKSTITKGNYNTSKGLVSSKFDHLNNSKYKSLNLNAS